MNNELDKSFGIATAAMLGSLNISVWEARKKDKTIEQEIANSKGARSRKSASVHKHLFAECAPLEAIKSLRGEARTWFNKYTMPWNDNGQRLFTSSSYFELMQDAAGFESRFNNLVKDFLGVYQTEVSKQAFERGAMFDRNEYPDVSEVAKKFSFAIDTNPVPLAGDFRVDIGNDALKDLQERLSTANDLRIKGAMQDVWDRIKTQVEWVHERMTAVMEYDPNAVEEERTYDDDGNVIKLDINKKRRPKLYDSMLNTGVELCGMLRDMNITNDPALEEARKMLEEALVRVDIDSLKESTEMQSATRSAMKSIMDKFAF